MTKKLNMPQLNTEQRFKADGNQLSVTWVPMATELADELVTQRSAFAQSEAHRGAAT